MAQSPLYGGGRRYDYRDRLASSLLAEGSSGAPIQSGWQGAARLAQALMGGYLANKGEEQRQGDEKRYTEGLQAAFAPQFQPSPLGPGPRQGPQGATMAPPDMATAAQRLLASGDSRHAQMASQMMMQDAAQRQAEAAKRADPMFGRSVVRNVGVVDFRGDSPQVIVPEQRQQPERQRFMNVPGVGLVDVSGEAPRVALAPQREAAQPERAARPLTPQERATFGIPETVPAFMGPDNKPQVMNIPQQGEVWDVDPQNPLIQINKRTGERKAMPGADKAEKAQEQAGNALIDTDRMIAQATELLNHPGRLAATGKSSLFNFIPGTDAYGFSKKLETLKAQVFLPEVQKMVGMGALSNAEGEKISAAFATLDTGMKEEEFQRSLQGALAQMQAARERFAAKAGGRAAPGPVSLGGQAAQGGVRTWNPATGRLE